jgi:hypothetical protein
VTKKQLFIVVDSETTIKDHVADFAAVVCDRRGNIVNQCAVLINGVYNVESLFYDVNANGIWAKRNLAKREQNYADMLNAGTRVIASVNAVNKWLMRALMAYKPTLTAYNLAFDNAKCHNTGIDLSIFPNSFCLWHAAAGNICHSREYRKFVLDNHLFNTPTAKGNMTYRTDAEAVTGFIKGGMTDEPHTALEDITGYEIPVLVEVLKRKKWRENIKAYNWVQFQVRKHFKAG